VDFRADAIVRLGGVDEEVVLAAFASSLVIVDEERATVYSDIVCAVLPEAARQLLEGLLATRTYEYQSDFVRRYVFQGRAEGLAEGRMEGEAIGEVTALLTVLAARRIDLPDEARARITACTDTATLTAWTGRAAIADRIEDVLD
jgi:hypothetical protein